MLYRTRAAFREPYGDSVIESMAPDQEIEVPDEMVARFVAEGHIEPIPPARLTETRTTPATVTAPVPELLHPESLNSRLLRIERHLWPEEPVDVAARDLASRRIADEPLSPEQIARRDDLGSREVTLTPDERTELALLRSHRDPEQRVAEAVPMAGYDDARRQELLAMPVRTADEDAELARLEQTSAAERLAEV